MKRLFFKPILVLLLSIVLVHAQTDDYYEEVLTLGDSGIWLQFGLNIFASGDEVVIYGEEALHCYQIDSGNWV